MKRTDVRKGVPYVGAFPASWRGSYFYRGYRLSPDGGRWTAFLTRDNGKGFLRPSFAECIAVIDLKLPRDLDIDDLPLSVRTRNGLSHGGFESYASVGAATDFELLKVPTIGRNALKEILKVRGICRTIANLQERLRQCEGLDAALRLIAPMVEAARQAKQNLGGNPETIITADEVLEIERVLKGGE